MRPDGARSDVWAGSPPSEPPVAGRPRHPCGRRPRHARLPLRTVFGVAPLASIRWANRSTARLVTAPTEARGGRRPPALSGIEAAGVLLEKGATSRALRP